MVILVDDEDDDEGTREQVPQETSSASRLGSNYTAEALPWDEKRPRTNFSGVSTSIWSDTAESKKSDDIGKAKSRRPMFRQPSEMGDSPHQPFVIRPGPKIAGRTYSVSSNSDRRISVDEESRTSVGGADSRPTSEGSTFVPIQSTMQPKVKIAGRPRFEGEGGKKAPINMPGRYVAERETGMDSRPSARRTYKSLSPYGILFED